MSPWTSRVHCAEAACQPHAVSAPPNAAQVLQDSAALFVAGCCFDELPPAVIMEGVRSHRATGGAVFFDPGPRSMTFRDLHRRKALHTLLDSTDVVLMTQVISSA